MAAILRLSPYETRQLAYTAWTLVALLGAVQISGFSTWGFLPPAAICGGLLVLAAVYDRRAPNFSLTLKSLAGFVGFTTVFCPLTYVLAQLRAPLVDPILKSCDLALGIDAGRIVSWVNARPALALVLRIVYFSAIPQTALAVAWLGLGNRQRELNQFLGRFMVCALLTAAGFAIAPAIGTPASYDIPVPAHYAPIIQHLTALRDGSLTSIALADAEGLICMPSFHAEWAVLLIAAFWRTPLRWPMLALNALMIASTIPIGMHYAADVLGGLAACAVVFLGERCFRPTATDAPAADQPVLAP